jgi:hypothetical protein
MPSLVTNVGFQGLKRKKRGHRQTVAIDPKPTSVQIMHSDVMRVS